MKRYIPILFVGITCVFAVLVSQKHTTYAKLETGENEEEESEVNDARASYVEDRARYEFDMEKDPFTGKIPAGIFEKELAYAKTLPVRTSGALRNGRIDALNTYFPAGPNNIGGRTRAVAYDVRYNGTTNRVIIAGCVSGGIMRSIDGGATWARVTPQNDLHTFTALAQDPRTGFQDTWYAGGGEFFGSSTDQVGAAYLSNGLWKSTDNGATWTKLPNNTITDINGSTLPAGTLEAFDNPFDIVHRIKINPANGDVYIAAHRRIVRTTDGGATFQVVFGSSVAANALNGQTDIAITNAGRVFVAINGGNPDPSVRGLWVSATGSLNSYTRIAGGQTLGVDSVAAWRGNDPTSGGKRILIALAPSDQNIGYVLYENGLSASGTTPQPEADLYKVAISGSTFTWSNFSANVPDYPGGNLSGVDPFTVQSGYDMVLKVSPSDPNTVYIAGTNLYRSFDGFATTSSIAWINGYAGLSSAAQYTNGHPDIHDLVFNPVNSNEAICADDGGLQMTTNVNAGTGSFILNAVSWGIVPNYQTLQYYYVAMDPDANRNNFIGGAQDNGVKMREKLQLFTPLMDSNDHRALLSGDGASVGISRVSVLDQTQYIYGSTQLGHAYRLAVATGSFASNIQPNGLTKNPSYSTEPGGEFVTNFKLDPDNTENLYYVNFNRLFRTTSASSVSAGGWTELTGVSSAINPGAPTTGTNIAIRALAFTRGSYHSGHSLFIGTTNGKVFRLDDPQNAAASAAPADITPSGMAGNVQDISVNPNDDNEIMVVLTNFNTTNIWWTNNAKALIPTWVNEEGNLSLPSIRSCAIAVKKDASGSPVKEYYVGTSIGLYSTASLAGTSTVWQREGGSVLNLAVVETMAYRPSDNVLLLGTHGNGMYYAFLGTPNFNPTQPTAVNPVTNDKNFIKTVYPTISANKVYFETGNMIGIKKINILVTDASGKLVYKSQAGYQNGSVPINNFASGVYILTIYSDDSKYRNVQKIIKQ